jgi:CHAD domain-containing protein
MRDVRAVATDAALHEWRKRAKDLQYELELLRFVHPDTIGPLVEQARGYCQVNSDCATIAV